MAGNVRKWQRRVKVGGATVLASAGMGALATPAQAHHEMNPDAGMGGVGLTQPDATQADSAIEGILEPDTFLKAFSPFQAQESGPLVNLNENNGMLLRDKSGRPAFMNYFDSEKLKDRKLTVSITTGTRVGDELINMIRRHQLPYYGMSDFGGLDQKPEQIIRAFFKEFESLTGIPVTVKENDPDANIIIGSYGGSSEILGYATFPENVVHPELSGSALGNKQQSFMLLNAGYMRNQPIQNMRKAVLELVSHEFGHNMGLQHPHEENIVTNWTDKQQKEVSRMAYSDHTSPAIAETDLESGYSAVDMLILRKALREVGFPVPQINTKENDYLLSELSEAQVNETASLFQGYLSSISAISIVDNGGKNTLDGTSGADVLVTESGDCGFVNHNSGVMTFLRDGQPYCLVEGEFSAVRSGNGQDLVLTANGTEQTVYTGTGSDNVALLHEDIGEKIIRSGTENDTTLTLHASALMRADATATQQGDAMVLEFAAVSGRETGKVTLPGQRNGGGIERIRVIDNDGAVLGEVETPSSYTAKDWQQRVIAPLDAAVQSAALDTLTSANYAKASQVLASQERGKPQALPTGTARTYMPPREVEPEFVDTVEKGAGQSQGRGR